MKARRACDSCRRRKIKCDSAPGECSNCRISDLNCLYSVEHKKRGPKPNSTTRGGGPARLGVQVASTALSQRRRAAQEQTPADGAAEAEAAELTTEQRRADWSQLVGIVRAPDVTSPCFSGHSQYGSSEAFSMHAQAQAWLPLQHFGVGTWPNSSIPDAREAASYIHGRLVAVLRAAAPSRSPRQLVDECVTLYFQFRFPINPICHEPTVRRHVERLFPDDGPALDGAASLASYLPSPLSMDNDPKTHLASLRAFALMTSLCAGAASILPDMFLPVPKAVIGEPLLQASRSILSLFQDYDAEHPNSESIAIRLFQASALHSCGRAGLSWHFLGQAVLLAQEMRLPYQSSIARWASSPLDAQLLRFSFWGLHIFNRSAAVLNNRPILLRDSLFDTSPDIPTFVGDGHIPLLDPSRPCNAPPFEERILAGTELCRRLWSSAAELIEGIHECARLRGRDRRRRAEQGQGQGQTTESQGDPGASMPTAIADLMHAYVDFAGILDDLPPWLQAPNSIAGADGEELLDPAVAAYQASTFWRLRIDVVVTFHCLRMVLLRRCAEHGLVAVMGLSEEPLMLAMRTAEIARDCLDTLDAVPFEYLLVNGEPLMEKIRQIGSALLQLREKTSFETIRERAKAYLARLLNTLARLDSKAVDKLNGDQSS